MSGRIGVVVAATLVVLAAAGSPASATRSPTVAKAITPLDSANHLAARYSIHHRYGDANCESGSPTAGKAYQCFTPQSPDAIYNSCWVQANHEFVICLVKPWGHKVTRLHVTRGFDDNGGFPKVTLPWGLHLAKGNRCLVILGPVHATHGKPINYSCSHHIVLAGKPDKRHAAWTSKAFREHHHDGQTTYKALGSLPIAVAWSGAPSQQD